MNAGNFDGVTPLHVACLAGDFISVQILLQAGANVRLSLYINHLSYSNVCAELLHCKAN